MNQSGAVALISVVVFATIITVVITAYLRSAVSQQKESVNYDLNNRAYYAAESGVQDAVRAIKNTPASAVDKDTCTPLAGGGLVGTSANFNLSYTCQIVDVDPAELTGTVSPNSQSVMIKLDPAVAPPAGQYKIVVRWSPKSNTDVLYPRGTDEPLFPPNNQWFQGGNPAKPVHALLRVAVITHPAGSFSRTSINQRVAFLNPTNEAAGLDNSSTGYGGWVLLDTTDDMLTQQKGLFNNATCYDSNDPAIPATMGTYSCMRTIRLTNYNLANPTYIRIGSAYRSTDFSVTLTDNSGVVIPIKNSQVAVDVTGKAGENTYRRIKQTVKLDGYKIESGPDAALVAGEGICKQITLGGTVANYKSDCNPLTD